MGPRKSHWCRTSSTFYQLWYASWGYQWCITLQPKTHSKTTSLHKTPLVLRWASHLWRHGTTMWHPSPEGDPYGENITIGSGDLMGKEAVDLWVG
ncbi:hypothetical protein RJ639_023347 [Escallonia herrerae]|uniref:Uncharacterized protein n=1 Tax=Escallonia herrerae TaxID=1293975 RepID=A0AA88UZI7_9ASTE|nr:hypothetical protein RJ639_023347 [Escallonia herrerae]